DLDVHVALEGLGYGAAFLGLLRDLIEFVLVDLGNGRLNIEFHGGDPESSGDCLNGTSGGGLDFCCRCPVFFERAAKRHAETRRFGRREQLLWIRAGAALETRAEIVLRRYRAALTLEASLTAFESAFPCRASLSRWHLNSPMRLMIRFAKLN
ncbi:MAG: hypothetical protein QOD47_1418, partial [Gemmatimonadaceae bacterium]|nr:hypothetical protein [Gemmatimonadaceae bacterium]